MKIFFLQQFIFSAVFLLEAHGTYFLFLKLNIRKDYPKVLVLALKTRVVITSCVTYHYWLKWQGAYCVL